MARNPNRQIYTIDIEAELDQFRYHHDLVGQIGIPTNAVDDYVHNTVEQIIAHFDVQSVGVQSFIAHYTGLIAEGQNPNYRYNPLRYLRPLEIEQYQHYMFCLYGLAESIYRALVNNGLFNARGYLIAGYEAIHLGTLYLEIRPELPDGLYLQT